MLGKERNCQIAALATADMSAVDMLTRPKQTIPSRVMQRDRQFDLPVNLSPDRFALFPQVCPGVCTYNVFACVFMVPAGYRLGLKVGFRNDPTGIECRP